MLGAWHAAVSLVRRLSGEGGAAQAEREHSRQLSRGALGTSPRRHSTAASCHCLLPAPARGPSAVLVVQLSMESSPLLLTAFLLSISRP